MKKLLTLLCLCCLCIGSAWGETVTFTMGTGKDVSSNDGSTKDAITITATDGTSNPNNWSGSTYVRLQAGGTMVITPKNATITEIVLNCTSGYEKTWSASVGSAPKVNTNNYTVTWTGSSTSAITLTNTASAQSRISNVVVTYKSGTTPTPTNPVINASDVTLEYNATSGEIAYNITNPVEGKSLTAESTTDWISNINVTAENSKVTFNTSENNGVERTGSITLKYEGATDKVIAVTQKKQEVDYVTLPFNWDGGGKEAFTALEGVTASGLGSNYAETNAPYLIKFDNTDDYIQFKTNEPIGIITIGVKMLGGATSSSITVKGSADGTNFTNVETLSISGKQNDIVNLETTEALDESYRYVRLVFTRGSNVGVGPITIAKPEVVDYWVVKYDTNDGTGTQTEVQVTKDESTNAPIVNPTRDGYTFAGWTSTKDGDDVVTFPYTPSANVTLYAKWTAIHYSITKNTAEHGSFSVTVDGKEVSTATYKTKLNLNNTPDTGYQLDKYIIDYTKEDGTLGQSNITTGIYNMPASNITITAVFNLIPTYTITLDNRGKIEKIKDVEEGSNILNAISEPTDEFDGYSFYGWSKSPVANASDLVGESETITKDITLYAVYRKSSGESAVTLIENLSDLTEGTYILASDKKEGQRMYLPSTESSGSNPTLKSLDLNEISNDMLWDLTSTGTANEYYVRPNGNVAIGLGTTKNTGTNIRISSSYKDTKWTFANSTDYNWQIKNNNDTPMYLAVYADEAWRNYSSSTINQNGKFYIYKYTAANTSYTLGTMPYVREGLTNGKLGTICLPKDGIVEGAELYSIVGKVVEDDTPKSLMLQDEGTELMGGMPYIFKATADKLTVVYDATATAEEEPIDWNGLFGTYETYMFDDHQAENTTYYVISSNKVQAVGANSGVNAYRAYLILENIPDYAPSAQVKGLVEFGFDGNFVDAINSINADKKQNDGAIYNLNGQRLNSLQKGLNIVNGKKIFIK